MKAGTAKVDVTPDRARYDVEKMLIDPPQAYHPVHARCLTLHDGARRMVFVTYDFNCLDYATPILRERVEKELGIPPAYLVLLATHNHQVPMQIIPSNFDYGEWLAEKIFGAIKEAIAREDGPVELHFGFGHDYGIRSSGAAATDYEVQLLKVSKGAKTGGAALQPAHASGPRTRSLLRPVASRLHHGRSGGDISGSAGPLCRRLRRQSKLDSAGDERQAGRMQAARARPGAESDFDRQGSARAGLGRPRKPVEAGRPAAGRSHAVREGAGTGAHGSHGYRHGAAAASRPPHQLDPRAGAALQRGHSRFPSAAPTCLAPTAASS